MIDWLLIQSIYNYTVGCLYTYENGSKICPILRFKIKREIFKKILQKFTFKTLFFKIKFFNLSYYKVDILLYINLP